MISKRCLFLLSLVLLSCERTLSFQPIKRRISASFVLAMAKAKCGGKLIETEAEFDKVVSKSATKPVMVVWTANWCAPCRIQSPVVKDVMKQFAKVVDVIEIDTDELPETAEKSGVVSIPTIQMYVEGEVKDTIVGCVAKSVLANVVQKVLEDIENASGPSRAELSP